MSVPPTTLKTAHAVETVPTSPAGIYFPSNFYQSTVLRIRFAFQLTAQRFHVQHDNVRALDSRYCDRVTDQTRRHIKLQISEQYRPRGGVHPRPGQAQFIINSFSPGGRRATALRPFYLLRLSGVALQCPHGRPYPPPIPGAP